MSNKCWACKDDLNDGQLLCKECKSWQNYRKYINFSNITLTLLIALISVIGAVGPRIVSMFSDETVTSSITNLDSKTLSLAVYYDGDGVAVLENPLECNIEISIKNSDTEKVSTLKYLIKSENSYGSIIRPGVVQTLKVRFGGEATINKFGYTPITDKESIYCATRWEIENNIDDFDLEFVNINFVNNRCITLYRIGNEGFEHKFSSKEIENFIYESIIGYNTPEKEEVCDEK
jgi:hypothetical protein